MLGGSQGARILNEVVPECHRRARRPRSIVDVRHQTGEAHLEDTRLIAYHRAGIVAEVVAFIEDVADAYGWADLVVCRAGALTISELAVAGVASVLVPFPHAVDDHQTRNGLHLANAQAALLIPQSDLDAVTRLACLAGRVSRRAGTSDAHGGGGAADLAHSHRYPAGQRLLPGARPVRDRPPIIGTSCHSASDAGARACACGSRRVDEAHAPRAFHRHRRRRHGRHCRGAAYPRFSSFRLRSWPPTP